MVQTSRHSELLSAWRALAGTPPGEGWRTIQIAQAGPCRFLAGRHFPGNQEALIAGFQQAKRPLQSQLPEGRGFTARIEEMPGTSPASTWIALCRLPAGSAELFSLMAEDLIVCADLALDLEGSVALANFLSRIRAWQDFMKKDQAPKLSGHAETGLYGELMMLRQLMRAGLPPGTVVKGWLGPEDGIHDLRLFAGAIEVKTALVKGTFPAHIGSLQQLDLSLVSPIYLSAIRLLIDDSGETLTDLVKSVRGDALVDAQALSLLNLKLLQAGYLDGVAASYTRRFTAFEMRMLEIDSDFPALTEGNVPSGVISAQYQIDIDQCPGPSRELDYVIQHLGVSQRESQ